MSNPLTMKSWSPYVVGAGIGVLSWCAFAVLTRFVITPLFLFGGVFYPVSELPRWLEVVAYATPLYHGVALCRGLTLHTLGWDAAAQADQRLESTSPPACTTPITPTASARSSCSSRLGGSSPSAISRCAWLS